ncbi:C40 family peptidase [Prauserella oleivorans]|uniref:C40 family peptidase n=1 Tax=Prauserella oleivorans TaxID=1478153 RepID=A0ABW5W5G8_9PSEU
MLTTPWKRTAVVGFVSGSALLGLAGTSSALIPTEQSLDQAPGTVARGSQVTFSGTLTGMNDRPLPGEPVDLEWRSGEGPWQVAGSATTDEQGAVSIPTTVEKTSQWRFHYRGDQIHDPSLSRAQDVQAQQPINQRIVDTAAAQAGKPYSYGASGPSSFDCSGLTQYVHKQVGIDLPRTSGDQYAAVRKIAQGDKVPGDLVFFHDGGSVYHVGIYAGGNQIWAAPESGDVVRKQDIYTSSYYVGRAW